MQDWLRLISSSTVFAALFVAGALSVHNAKAEKIWNWSYAGSNIAASGTFTTSETMDSQGFYQIYSIAGHRNGELIEYPFTCIICLAQPKLLEACIPITG